MSAVADHLRNIDTGAWIDNGTVTEIIGTNATINLGGLYVTAKIPAHLRGVATVGCFVEIIGAENHRIIIAVLSAIAWQTAGFSPASGWSLDYAGFRFSAGPQINLICRVNRTGSTITASSSGHLADTDVAVAPAALLPPSWPIPSIPFVWRTSYSIGGGYLGPSTGNLVLTDLHPNASITAGDQMQMQVSYPV